MMPKNETSLEEIGKYMGIRIDSSTTVGSSDAPSFIRYLLRLANGIRTFTPVASEIGMLASGYPGKRFSDEQKIEYLKKLERAGINLFP